MAMYFYYSMFGISLALVIIYAFVFHKHFNATVTIMSVLVPVINLSFVLMAQAKTIEEALVALKLTYLGGCYLLVTVLFLIFSTCGVHLKSWIRAVIIAVSSGVYATALTIGKLDIFYVGTPDLAFENGAAYITNKTYGFMHTVFYVMVIVFYLAIVAVIIYSFFRKKQIPITILILLALAVSIAMLGFFGGRMITPSIELLPATYNIGLIIYLIISSRLRLYNASDSVIDSLVEKGDTGFVSFDAKMRYLDSNETAKKMLPELAEFRVDHMIQGSELADKHFLPMVEEFKKDGENNKHFIEKDGKIYLVHINRLSVGRLYRGYQFFLTDDTVNQEHIRLIKTYNSQLEEEVARKTANVVEMQNKLVLGMATMIEGRDNSTGGHIKRTSDGVRFLIEEMKKDNFPGLTESFCRNVIRAAPMHDLGKIAVDDAILRKPGKYTPEEFEIMKTHAAEGARIVHQILEGTEDVEFHHIAENVAHYHHERWDGSGYPKKLKGEEIPLEARIMAIADVYDALVSKRVYKERMSFETANSIIMDGMGKQFDKALEPYYIKARPKFEEYYSNLPE